MLCNAIVRILLLTGLAAALSACAEVRALVAVPTTVSVEPDEAIVIGVSAAFTGEGVAAIGLDIRRGVELALRERPNISVDGRVFPLTIEAYDDACSPEGGQLAANRLTAAERVVGVIGPMCSSACRAGAPIFDLAHFTTLSPSCTSPDLTVRGFSSFNRTVVSDAYQGAAAAQFIQDYLGVSRLAVIHDRSPYGEGLARVLTQQFTRLGGEVSEYLITTGQADYRSLLLEIVRARPQLIYFAGFSAEGALLADQRADVGLGDVLFMGADGLRTQSFIDLAETASEGTYASSAFSGISSAMAEFLATYQEVYAEAPPAPYHASAFDGTQILIDAVEAASTLDASGNLVIDRLEIARYVRSLENWRGLAEVYSADASGEMVSGVVEIAQVCDGQFVSRGLVTRQNDAFNFIIGDEDGCDP